MKIVMAASCSSDPNLGVPGVMHSLADQYRAAGHEVRMVFRDRPGRVGEILFGWRLSRSLDTKWADLVDCHAAEAWPLSARRHRPTVVARSHGLELGVHRRLMESCRQGTAAVSPIYWTYRGSIRLLSERLAIKSADATLLLNAADFATCSTEFGVPAPKLHLVPNGYPANFLTTPIDDHPRPGILFLGSWIHRKGIDLAVEAITASLKQFPETPVLLAGTGVDRDGVLSAFPPELHRTIAVCPRFRREQLPELVRDHSILLFPSRSEGYPLSLVEAMACGIAPVATAIPGVVEVVEHNRSGVLVPSEDSAALQQALLGLLAAPDQLAALRSGARQRVRGTSWDQIAVDQLEIYRRTIRTRSGDRTRASR